MLKALTQKYAARRLNRDAVTVIASDTHSHRPEHLAAIAAQIAEYLQLARDASALDVHETKTLGRLKAIHGEARMRRDQIALSAATLAIIYFRAQQLGEVAQPAMSAIDRFVERWRPAGSGD